MVFELFGGINVRGLEPNSRNPGNRSSFKASYIQNKCKRTFDLIRCLATIY